MTALNRNYEFNMSQLLIEISFNWFSKLKFVERRNANFFSFKIFIFPSLALYPHPHPAWGGGSIQPPPHPSTDPTTS